MSGIDELITELSPMGVPFRPLWQLTSWDKRFNAVERNKQSKVLKYNYLLAGEMVPLIVEGGDVKLLTTSTSDLWTTEELAGDAVSDAEIVAIPWGGNPNVQYYKGRFVTADNRIAVSNDCNVLDTKFLYYLMQEQLGLIGSFYRGSGIKHPSMAKVLDLRIPVPPIGVQRDVVRALDLLGGLEAELEAGLEAELEARQLQHVSHRDSLLSLDSLDYELLTLRDVSTDFGRGKSRHRPRNDPSLYDGHYPFIQTGDIRGSGHLITEYSQTYNDEGLAQSKLWPRGTVCITIAANIAETGILGFDACFPDSVIGMIVDPKKASPYFVEYLLQSLKATLTDKGRGSAQANINLGTFENERFPFPSLNDQQRIVSILDRFQAAIGELSGALRAERDARRKQYEHYRGELLTFKELVA